MAQLYRKSAPESISSPEQLDKALKLSSPLSWLALLGLTLIVIVVIIWSIVGTIPITVSTVGVISPSTGINTIYAEDAGTIRAIRVLENSEIHQGDVILEYQAGERKVILSNQVGYISEILVKNGDQIKPGTELVRITPKLDQQGTSVAVCFVPFKQILKVERGMNVQIYLEGKDYQDKGHMMARVINIDSRPASDTQLGNVLGSNVNLINEVNSTVSNDGAVIVTCELYPDNTENGYWWSSEKGSNVKVPEFASIKATIEIGYMKPIEKLFSKIKEIWN